jgi:AcrR family transcriptional regulator
VTVRGVCDAAGLTSRYFYEGFADREALAVAVFDGVAGEATGRVLAAVAGAPETALDKARGAIAAFVALVDDDARKARVLFAPAPELPALTVLRAESTHAFATLVAAQARAFYNLEPGEGGPFVDVTASMLTGGLAQTLLDWTSGALVVSADELVDDCALLFVAAGEAGLARLRRG